ncbi:MAG: S49 family peptidase [Alphaproteobacteria bacterium]|nr:MAG: S49 family peptidase [Alphaproteobacteria bacterium]
MFEKIKKLPIPFIQNRVKPKVAVVRLQGAISSGGRLGQGLNLAGVAQALDAAFDIAEVKAVALLINSPGGSPVQANLIHKRVRALSEEKKIPVYAFCEDVAASGGYMLALAADEIFADTSSVIGSIGVISAGFGFTKAIEKLGVERRVYTAGENKSTLDPFLPENPEDVERLKKLQLDVHAFFKDMVRARRGDKLKGEDKELFNGEFWAGEGALERGLIDGIADLRAKMREIYGEKIKLVPVTADKSFWRRGQAGGVSASDKGSLADLLHQGAEEAMIALEERGLWAKFGL